MLLRCILSELMKCRRNPVWLAFMILPLFPAVLGTFNYLGNIEVLQNGWYSLWTQHTLFSSFFFLPAQLSVFCAWQWRLEHTGHNWNRFMTAPVDIECLYLAKLIVAAGISVLAQACIGALFLLGGTLAGLKGPFPRELWNWLGWGALGGLAVCAVQLLLSLIIRSFAVPVGMGLLGGVVGMLAMAKGWGYSFPYALLPLGMRANDPARLLSPPLFALSCAAYIALFAAAAICVLRRRDVTAD